MPSDREVTTVVSGNLVVGRCREDFQEERLLALISIPRVSLREGREGGQGMGQPALLVHVLI